VEERIGLAPSKEFLEEEPIELELAPPFRFSTQDQKQ
jgi:hypothetical protein